MPTAVVGIESDGQLWQAVIGLGEQYQLISVDGPLEPQGQPVLVPVIFTLGVLMINGGSILLFTIRKKT
jgi:hypothetical protein